MKIIRLSFFLVLSIAAAGCYYDTQEKLYGITSQSAPCTDTSGVTYSTNLDASKSVSAIIDVNCNSCHSQSQAQRNGGSIILDTYSGLIAQANTNGNLMGDINHNTGHNAMPLSGNKLSNCQIAVIQHWIDLGEPQN